MSRKKGAVVMKNKMWRTVTLLILGCMLVMTLVSCKPAKMEKIIGTYELVTDTVTRYQQDMVDHIATYEREAYIVLTGEEIGYYVYKDKDTSVCVREIKLEYFKNDEEEVSRISFTLGVGEKGNSLNVDSGKDSYLVSRWPSATKITPAYEIQYKKISDATDLSTVEGIYGDLPVFRYGLYDYNRTYIAQIDNGLDKNFSDYIYKYYAVDSARGKATLYYALKSDKVPVAQRNIDVTFTKDAESDKYVKMTIGTDEYDLTAGLPRRPITVMISGEAFDAYEELGYFVYPEVKPEDYDEYFKGLINEYEASLSEESGE